ncbi:MAG: GTP 3',8-cyclase MoaA, partial [Terriglobales bacterium]
MIPVAILAGGASRRMGRPKAWLDWKGKPLLAHMVALARQAGAEKIAVVAPARVALPEITGVERLYDVVNDRGPLGGVLAALRWAPRVLVAACDLPHLPAALLQYLAERGEDCEGWTWPENQPLCAVYTQSLVPGLEAAAATSGDVPSLGEALASAAQQQLSPDELSRFGPDAFDNLNTPADYQRARGGLYDSCGRAITDLRLSVTERCNYRCIYCRYGDPTQPTSADLPWEQLELAARVFASLGIRKLRLTGGEPLLRPGLVDFVGYVAGLAGLDIALTTNGHLLAPLAAALKAAGLRRVTVSLDSLQPDKAARITRVPGGLGHVLDAIGAAREAGLAPVKVNVVLVRGVNDEEIEAFAAFAREHEVALRFIEFMPLEQGQLWSPERVVPLPELRERLERAFPLSPLPQRWSETARRFRFADGAPGEIGIIAPVSSPFCNQCSRIRMTADGQLRTCLFSLHEWDLRPALAAGDEEELATLVRRAVLHKEERHHIGEPDFQKPGR